jgi:hypothetical protein
MVHWTLNKKFKFKFKSLLYRVDGQNMHQRLFFCVTILQPLVFPELHICIINVENDRSSIVVVMSARQKKGGARASEMVGWMKDTHTHLKKEQ